jgi:hypothetical protein
VGGPSNEARNRGSDFNLVRLPRSDSDLDLSLEELRVEFKRKSFYPKRLLLFTSRRILLRTTSLNYGWPNLSQFHSDDVRSRKQHIGHHHGIL